MILLWGEGRGNGRGHRGTEPPALPPRSPEGTWGGSRVPRGANDSPCPASLEAVSACAGFTLIFPVQTLAKK